MTKPNETSQIKSLKYAVSLAAYLLIVWGFYRFLFQLPENIEEIVIKPIIWLVPVLYLLKREGAGLESIGVTLKNIFPALYFALGLGVFFVMEAILINFIKYGGSFNFGANIGSLPILASFGLSFATAFSEELAFRGYILSRFWNALKNPWQAIIITSLLWALVHVPITFFVWKLDLTSAVTYLVLTFIFGLGSSFVYTKTKNVFSSILLHVLWQWPIILFR